MAEIVNKPTELIESVIMSMQSNSYEPKTSTKSVVEPRKPLKSKPMVIASKKKKDDKTPNLESL